MERHVDDAVGRHASQPYRIGKTTAPELRDERRDVPPRLGPGPFRKLDGIGVGVDVEPEGDVYARYRVRVAEMRQSVRIARQAIDRISPTGVWSCGDTRVVPPPKDKVYSEMEALIQHFLIYSQGFNVPKGECYVPVEGPRGEHGFYIVSDGGNRPIRVKSRAP